MCGDLNAYHSKWSLGTTNRLGKEIISFCSENDLTVLVEKDSSSHQNRKTRKLNSPDFFMVSREFKNSMVKTEADLGSDHLPIEIKIEIKSKKKKLVLTDRWILNKLNQDKFCLTLEEKLKKWLIEYKDHYSTESAYSTWTNTLLESFESSCPKNKKKTSFHGSYWWNDTCSEAVKKRRNLRRIFQRSRSMKSLLDYRKQHSITKRIIKEAKK